MFAKISFTVLDITNPIRLPKVCLPGFAATFVVATKIANTNTNIFMVPVYCAHPSLMTSNVQYDVDIYSLLQADKRILIGLLLGQQQSFSRNYRQSDAVLSCCNF